MSQIIVMSCREDDQNYLRAPCGLQTDRECDWRHVSRNSPSLSHIIKKIKIHVSFTFCFSLPYNTRDSHESLTVSRSKISQAVSERGSGPDVVLIHNPLSLSLCVSSSAACQCNGHSTCVNGSVCEQCRNLTTGPHCQTCMPGYHGDPTNGGKCQGECRIGAEMNSAHGRLNGLSAVIIFGEAVNWCSLTLTPPCTLFNRFSTICVHFISVYSRSTLSLNKYNANYILCLFGRVLLSVNANENFRGI